MSVAPFTSIAVIGAGAWGTALASLTAGNGVRTLIWAREADVAQAINETRENAVFLPGVDLPENLCATTELADAADAEALLMVTPAQHARTVLTALRPHLAAGAPVALCSKGIETQTGKLMTDVLAETCPGVEPAILSGPSFAADVARGLPTAVTLACRDESLGARWVATVGAPHFRPYYSDDLIGVELGGAVKNVLAIAAGVVVGLGLGESARAALVARGFNEFRRLAVALGARPETLHGMSGLGDLVLTASSPQSRNMSLGIALGEGRAMADVLAERNSVAEGVATAPAVLRLAQQAGVETPILAAVDALVAGEKSVADCMSELLARPFKPEAE